MKRILIIYSLLMFGVSNCASGQYHAMVPYFTGRVEGNSIHLRWVVSGGNTCNGIRIYHSDDSLNYALIGEIGGICGNASSDITYEFTHENVQVTGNHYYKLELGFQGYSNALRIPFYNLNAGYVVFPNPGSNEFTVVVHQVLDGSFIDIYNANGQLIQREYLLTGTMQQVNMYDHPAGFYMVVIRDDKKIHHQIKWMKH